MVGFAVWIHERRGNDGKANIAFDGKGKIVRGSRPNRHVKTLTLCCRSEIIRKTYIRESRGSFIK